MKCYVKRCLLWKYVDNSLIKKSVGFYSTSTTTSRHYDWFFRIDFRTATDISNHKLDPMSDDIFYKTIWEF